MTIFHGTSTCLWWLLLLGLFPSHAQPSPADQCTFFNQKEVDRVCRKPTEILDSIETLSLCEKACADRDWCQQISWKKAGNAVADSPMACDQNSGKQLTSDMPEFTSPSDAPSPSPSSCTPKNSVPNDCSKCMSHDQCATGGFCCPFMKKCVTSSSQGCSLPIASCSPPCHKTTVQECPQCTNTAFRAGEWQSPTCGRRRRLSGTDAVMKMSTVTGPLLMGENEWNSHQLLSTTTEEDSPVLPGQVSSSMLLAEYEAATKMLRQELVQIGESGRRRLVVSETDKQAFLDSHNKWRAKTGDEDANPTAGMNPTASNMRYMAWDDKLQVVAQNYADMCVWKHNPNRNKAYKAAGGSGYIGENLAAGSGGMSPEKSTYMWDEEKKGYTYATGKCTVPMCGHYTQTSWALSSKVGCGISKCKHINGLSYGGTYVVCNYSPAGNWVGEKPYKSGEKGSSCPSGTTAKQYADFGKLCATSTELTDVEKTTDTPADTSVAADWTKAITSSSCILSRGCSETLIEKDWVVRSKVREYGNDAQIAFLVGETNYGNGVAGGAVILLILSTLMWSMAHHAQIEGHFARELDFALRTEDTYPSDVVHSRSQVRGTKLERAHNLLLCCKDSKTPFLGFHTSQCTASLIVWAVLFGTSDFRGSWMAQWWIISHLLVFFWSLAKALMVYKKGVKRTGHLLIAFCAFMDLIFLVLVGISAITVSAVETKNFDSRPKAAFVSAMIFIYMNFFLCSIALFLTYSAWHMDGAPDGGVGVQLRHHHGKADTFIKCQRILQVISSLIALILVAVTPFFAMSASAILLIVICSLQVVFASVQFASMVIKPEAREKFFGKEKRHFFVFLICDVVSMLIMGIGGLSCGEELKTDPIGTALVFVFILFFSYGSTVVCLFLALRGDLPLHTTGHEANGVDHSSSPMKHSQVPHKGVKSKHAGRV